MQLRQCIPEKKKIIQRKNGKNFLVFAIYNFLIAFNDMKKNLLVLRVKVFCIDLRG